MSEIQTNRLGTADVVICIFLVLVSITIGLLFALRNRHSNNTVSYFLGNRRLSALPVALSFVVTFQSSILILGFPAETYFYGMQIAIQSIGCLAAYWLASVAVVPIFYPLKVTSFYKYYALRYKENSVRYVAVVGGIIYYLIYIGIVLYGTALALKTVANLPLWFTVIVFTVVAVLYTAIGGMQAVVWTDVFQSLVMLAGILAVIIRCCIEAGGPVKVINLGKSRFNFFNFDPDPTERHTFWTLLIGSGFHFFHLTISQASIQRINSTPTIRSAKFIMYISGPIFAFTWVLSLFEGVTLYAYYKNKGCDPMASGQISNMNQIVPYSIVELFHGMPGFPGLIVAALSAASLSTISSGLSSLTAITYEDVIKQMKPNMSESSATNISKLVVVLFGILAAGVSSLLMYSKGPLGQIMMSFTAAINGPNIGLYITTISFRRANPKAMVFASLVSFGLIVWISAGQNFSASLSKSSFLPLGPTTNCTVIGGDFNSTIITANKSIMNKLNIHNSTLTGVDGMMTTTLAPVSDRTALQILYSISYLYFNVIGALVVVVVGVSLSLIIQSDKTLDVDEQLLFYCKRKIVHNKTVCHTLDNDKVADIAEMQPFSDCLT